MSHEKLHDASGQATPPPDTDPLAQATRRAARQEAEGQANPEPSLGRRLGQIGILGWAITLPSLIGLFVGRWLDRSFGTGVLFSAALLMVGAGVGLWSAWRWMHRQTELP
ncbi:AtpZ/AtpI family protein [Pandoraea communis]|uniref:AtpZ/AtpI family protein n=1 Tax=Pandoraea communis TaxID=2508297 RepID=UPI0020C22104|nr:AtpZ/AtpI family protein [Pandoraea communis]